MNTQQIYDGLRQDMLVAKAVPLSVALSLPIPVLANNVLVLQVLTIPFSGKRREAKKLNVPSQIITTEYQTGKVIRVADATALRQGLSQKDGVIGTYPGLRLQGLSVQKIAELRRKYYETTDRLCEVFKDVVTTTRSFAECTAWCTAFLNVVEDGMIPFYRVISPELFTRVPVDAGQVTPACLLSEQGQSDASSPEPRERPCNIAQALGGWIRGGLALAEEIKADQIASRIKDLDARRRMPGFRLAFVGEFSRGKSTLINRLLERDLLPVGATPTTATITSIVPATEECMVVYRADGQQERRSLAASSWDNLSATKQQDGETPFPRVRLAVNNAWLRELDAEILDTPGTNDLSGQRAALALDVLSQCDAAVLLVSASSPFSITERYFLQHEVMGRHVSRIVVAVSKLDTIPPAERKVMLTTIEKRIASVASNIPIVPTYGTKTAKGDAQAMSLVRQSIAEMASRADRSRDRNTQVALSLADHLKEIEEVAAAACVAAKMTDDERARSLRSSLQQLRESELAWEDLRLELARRRLRLEQSLRSHMVSWSDEVIVDLRYNLENTPNPKKWWKSDMLFYFHKKMAPLSEQLKQELIKGIDKDIEWLSKQVADKFGSQVQRITPDQSGLEGPGVRTGHIDLLDIKQQRFRYRLGTIATTLAAPLVLGPLGMAGMAVSLASGLFAETVLDGKLEEQRAQLVPRIEPMVDSVRERYVLSLSQRLCRQYTQVIDSSHRDQRAWSTARSKVLTDQFRPEDVAHWRERGASAAKMRAEILAALGENATTT